MKTIKEGYIRITDKVYFEYYDLEKPNPNSENYFDYATPELSTEFIKAMKEYESSKRLVEVSNVSWSELSKRWLYGKKMAGTWENGPKNNQPCEAEIKYSMGQFDIFPGNKAIIIKITKG